MVHHSSHRQGWFDDALQVPYVLPHKIDLLLNVDKNKKLYTVLEGEVCTLKLYNSRYTPHSPMAVYPWIQ
jgi:hypothetical protein